MQPALGEAPCSNAEGRGSGRRSTMRQGAAVRARLEGPK
jgi:hypothetical protein